MQPEDRDAAYLWDMLDYVHTILKFTYSYCLLIYPESTKPLIQIPELIRNRFKGYRTITATWLETSVVLADVCVRKG